MPQKRGFAAGGDDPDAKCASVGILPEVDVADDDMSALASPQPVASLALISRFEDIWAMICSLLSGDAISNLCQVQYFRQSTSSTPAYQLLSGLNNNGFLVPWNDVDNVMSCRYVHHPYHSLSFQRVSFIYGVADMLLRGSLHAQVHPDYKHSHWRGGPARPSSPDCFFIESQNHICRAPIFQYHLPNPFLQDHGGAPAVVFGLCSGFVGPPFWRVLVGEYTFFDDASDCGDDI
jgi:hypothetical protein